MRIKNISFVVLMIVLLVSIFSIVYMDSNIFPETILSLKQFRRQYDENKECIDSFFMNIVSNIENLKNITDAYDN